MISHIQWPWDYVLLFTCSIITFAILWCKFSSKARLPPGPRGLPLLGYLRYTKLAQQYGPIFRLKLGSKIRIVVGSSDLAKIVLREQDQIFASRDPPIAGTVVSYGRQSIIWSDNNSLWRNMRKVLRESLMDAIFERIIKERIAIKRDEAVEKMGRKDFLQILLELKEQNAPTSFSITQIKALLMEIFLGTTDTTSTMVEWTMAELLKYPSMMQKVKDELKEVVGLNNIVQESHLSNLKYLDAVVKETFRLHPPVPMLIVRCPNKSCIVGGYTVPKGADVYVNVWAIHRDPQYWDNPLEFNPNRFLSVDDGTTKFDYNGYNPNFIPFGSGRRRCLGAPLGEKMLVYILASMLHSFDWTLPNGEWKRISEKRTKTKPKQQNRAREWKEREKYKKLKS
ncbi:geraniol 8-hydroxylase-like protein [Tanacetum coccineum]